MTAITEETTVEQLAAIVAEQLRRCGINAVLSGGALVSLYSENQYQSHDLDFVTSAAMKELSAALEQIGFTNIQGRHFSHPGTKFLVEFPTGPAMVGRQVVNRPSAMATGAGTIMVLSPTDSVKDRLAAFIHWNDRQGLEQAEMIASRHPVDVADIEHWTAGETPDEGKRALVKARIAKAVQALENPPGDTEDEFLPH